MLKGSKAFSTFSVNDLDAAKDFYEGVLGLDTAIHPMGVLQLKVAGSSPVVVYPKEDHTPATFTVLNFPVADVERAVDELVRRGVSFEQYQTDAIETDAKGIARDDEGRSIAWFKDPAGNVLSIVSEEMA